MPKCMDCGRKFEQVGTIHVKCKTHSPCNVDGQFSVRDCPRCTRAVDFARNSSDRVAVSKVAASLRDWTGGMAKNKIRPEGTPFWKYPEER